MQKFTGSGDTTFNFLLLFVVVLLSVMITLLWSILDRKRNSYTQLHNWSLLFVGFYVGYIMLIYGFGKVFYLQFRQPNLEILLQSIGQSSPMHLMWVFMGSSKVYTVFSGYCEVVAGILLINKRTRTLGALVLVGVMLNVFLMNMSYDVPVKLKSFTYMLIGIYIMSPKLKKLLDVVLLNQPTEPDLYQPYIKSTKWNVGLNVSMFILGAYIVYVSFSTSLRRTENSINHQPEPALYGVYEAQDFIKNGDTIPPLITDESRWRYLIIDRDFRRSNSAIKDMTGQIKKYNTKIDTISHTMEFVLTGDSLVSEMSYQMVDNRLMLEGIMDGDTLSISCERYKRDDFLLHSRGFNWINETPYNRYDYEGLTP